MLQVEGSHVKIIETSDRLLLLLLKKIVQEYCSVGMSHFSPLSVLNKLTYK